MKRIHLLLFFLTLTFLSCKTDEFKFKQWTIDEQWRLEVVTPLLSGEMEFKDFIYNWKQPLLIGDEDARVELLYPADSSRIIPEQIIFDPSVVLDSFNFFIQGRYDIVEAVLIFQVKNGAPFPLNLQMQFFEKERAGSLGPPIRPEAFNAGDFTNNPEQMVASADSVLLNDEQLNSFRRGNQLRVTSWFNRTDYINQHNTLRSDYPIQFSVILRGKVKAADEN